MRSLIAIACVGVMLWGGMSMPARAQDIAIAGDTLLDISLRDADLSETLTALFSTAKDKYEMVLGSGVTGRIARLQLTQAPFEKALDAILGSDYSYSKKPQTDGRFLYRITGRQGRSGTGLRGSGSVIVAQAPPLDADLGRQLNSTLMAQMGGFDAMTPGGFVPPSGGASGGYGASSNPAGGFSSPGGVAGGAGFWGGSSRPGGIASAAGMPASTESFIIKLIRINNIDIAALCDSMGMETIDLGSLMDTTDSGSSRGGSRGGSRGTSRNNDNNYNNNNNYDNNNTSSSSNRTNRTNRTSRSNTNTTANSNYLQ